MESNLSNSPRSYDYNMSNGSDFSPKSMLEHLSVSKELLYIVMVMTIIGPLQRKTYEERVCTGTLIRNDMVLTLASCLVMDHYEIADPDTISVYERPNVNRLLALRVFINNKFHSEDMFLSKAHDFGLIVVEKSKQTDFPQLPKHIDGFKDIKKTCKMGGYGIKEEIAIRNFHVYDFKQTEVDQLGGGACTDNKKLCLHFPGIMPCQADQGTPIICDGVLYALHVPRYNRLSSKCFDIYMIMFSPVYNVKDWLEDIVEAPTSNLEWLSNPWWVLLLCIVVFTIMGAIYYGLVEALKRTFDPADGMQTQNLSAQEEGDDEDSWYSVPGISR